MISNLYKIRWKEEEPKYNQREKDEGNLTFK